MKSEGRSCAKRLPFSAENAPAFRLPPSAFRPAYTLVELLLVLTILCVIAAVAWPSVLRMQADHDLSAAVEDVRQQLGNARTWAIHSGAAYQFRFEPKGQRFCVVPFEPEPMPAANAGNSGSAVAPTMRKFGGAVAKKIAFISRDASGLPSAQKIPEAALAGLPNASELSNVGWSGPIVFTPEGTAIDAVVTLGDARGYRIDVTIRGLTGAAAAGAMYREGR
jgi:prepilin-type N-terminal cleavage/methylation domain-containing protein